MASRAIKGGSLTDYLTFDGGLASFARLFVASVNVEFLREIARFAIAADEVSERSSASFNGIGQSILDGGGEFFHARFRHVCGDSCRMDTGDEKRLASVDVADANDYRIVHDQKLDSELSAIRGSAQMIRSKTIAQRLWSEMAEQLVRHDIDRRWQPVDESEASWIVEPQLLPGV